MLSSTKTRFNSDITTAGVRVRVEPFYIPEDSYPDDDRYVFGYRVTMTNNCDFPVQLISRRWIIIDGDGKCDEVEGPGVVGRQPWLKPGESFRYTSYCPIHTEWGTMEGSYLMEEHGGKRFRVNVARFVLAMKEYPQEYPATISLE